MQQTVPYLSLSIWLPIAFGLVILAVGDDRRADLSRMLALVGSLASFAVTVPLYTGFDNSSAALQFVESLHWIDRLGATYGLGVDGISLWFVLLSAGITVIVVISAWQVVQKNVAQYMAAFLILSGLLVGVFAATDGLLFYVFFEATLIPMFIIIGIWGGPRRVYAAIKFFLYTLLGSLLTMVAIVYLWYKSGGSAFDRARPVVALWGLFHGVCGQGADVAGSHLAARCPRRGAHRRLGRTGSDHAEARGVRVR
jgi:NADH-quinone oxidoreductase subunit M